MKFNLKDFLELDTKELFAVNGGYYCTGSSGGSSPSGSKNPGSTQNGGGGHQTFLGRDATSVKTHIKNPDGSCTVVTVSKTTGKVISSYTYGVTKGSGGGSSGGGSCGGYSSGSSGGTKSSGGGHSSGYATSTGGSCSSSGGGGTGSSGGSGVPPNETDITNPVEVSPTISEETKKDDNSVALNAGWQITSDSNSFTMYEYENDKSTDKLMNDTYDSNGKLLFENSFSTDGCKMTGAAKIAQDLTGNDVSILNVNDGFDSNRDGLLTQYEIENGINNLLEEQGCTDKKVVSNKIEGAALSRETFDSIVNSKDTVYVLGCCEFTKYNAEKKETYTTQHWVVLEGMHSGEYGQYVFNVDGTSKYDSSRSYVFGDVPVSEKDSVRHITKIETFTLTTN